MLTTQGRDRRLLGVFMVLPAGRPFFPPPAFSFRMSHSTLCLLNSCTTRSQLTTLPQKQEGLVRDWCCWEYQMQQTGGVLDCQLHHMLTAHHTKKAWSGIGAARNIKCSRLDCFGLSAAPHTHSSPHYHRRKEGLVRGWSSWEYQMQQTDGVLDCLCTKRLLFPTSHHAFSCSQSFLPTKTCQFWASGSLVVETSAIKLIPSTNSNR